ncbi:MAG TPA: DUF6491 family protein [Allosphingosinicella sp.]
MKTLPLALGALLSTAAAAQPPALPQSADEEVSIPFVSFGAIRNWEERGDDLVYLQDQHLRWYRVRLDGSCRELPFATAIGIDTRGSPAFDRFSALRVGGDLCTVRSVTRSGPPPKKEKPRR